MRGVRTRGEVQVTYVFVLIEIFRNMNANKMLVMGGLGPKWGEGWVIQRFVEKLLSVSMLCGLFWKGLGANNKLK